MTTPAPADRRLLAPALAAWLSALCLLGSSPRVAALFVGVAGGGAGTLLIVGRWRAAPTARILAATLLAAAAAGAAVATRLAAEAGPLRDLARGRARAVVEAVLTDDPRVVTGCAGAPVCRPRFLLHARAEAARTTRVRAPVLLVVRDPSAARLLPSQRVRVVGRLTLPERGGPLAAVVRVEGTPRVLTAPSRVQRFAASVRHHLQAAVAGLPSEARGLLPGMVLGDTSGIDRELAADFQDAGLTHLTAVSGANLALVIGPVVLLGRLARLRPGGVVAGAAMVAAAYIVVVRPSPSVLRAAAMAAIALLALWMGRVRDGPASLAAAVLVLVLFSPELARAYGFALSILATAGVLLLAPAWRDRLSRRLPRPIAEAIAVPAAAQLACAPVLAMLAAGVSLVAIPANLLAAPAVPVVTVLGALAAALAPLSHPVAATVAWPAGLAAQWVAWLAHTLAALPRAVLPWPAGLGGALALLAIAAAGWITLRTPRLRALAAACAVGLLVAAIAFSLIRPTWPPRGWLLVACDVGQGDALALAAGPGRAIVIDSGPQPRDVDRCLRRLGVTRVPLLILTHAHSDHVGGLAGVLRGRTVGSAVASPHPLPREETARVGQLLRDRRVPSWPARAGQRWVTGGWQLTVLSPRPDVLAAAGVSEARSPNEASTVVWARSAALSVLLGADVQEHTQRLLLDAHQVPPALVFKVPHHGSRYQDPGFVAAVTPRVALISVGAGNPYGHPAPVTLERLRRAGVRIYRTDRDGDVAIVRDRHGLAVVARR